MAGRPQAVQIIVGPPDAAASNDLHQFDSDNATLVEGTNSSATNLRERFMRKGKKKIGVKASLRAIVLSSWLNFFLVFVPFAWISHFSKYTHHRWSERTTFGLSFLSLIPLARLLEYGAEELSFYLGKHLGDLAKVTLNNAVEAILAIMLLVKCDIRVLKSTIIGVVILRLLLVPGTAFIIGGARIVQQDLNPHITQLNQSMLILGVLTILIPAAFFAGLNGSFSPPGMVKISVVSDRVRGEMLMFSRGLAVLLIIVYICSRVYLHNPPGEEDPLSLAEAPKPSSESKEKDAHHHHEDPEVNQWVCIVFLLISIAVLAFTAEWLILSADFVRRETHMEEEWFGLILLPLISFTGDAVVAIVYYIRLLLRHFLHEPEPPTTLAQGEAIDLSIQFILFWMPFLILLGWWTGKPVSLLFDQYQVAVLVGACFLVNYVTADAKTNWAEGMAMVTFYIMIALCTWYYSGQPEMSFLSECSTVSEAIAIYIKSNGTATRAYQ